MTSINDLAGEFGTDVNVIYAFGNLSNKIRPDEALELDDVAAIRECWKAESEKSRG